jgi:uncharacterized protein YjiS (DUF1127 family)
MDGAVTRSADQQEGTMVKGQTISGYPVAGEKPAGSRFASIFAEFCAGVRDGRDLQAQYDELSRMTPGELKRLGLTREDITRFVATRRSGE